LSTLREIPKFHLAFLALVLCGPLRAGTIGSDLLGLGFEIGNHDYGPFYSTSDVLTRSINQGGWEGTASLRTNFDPADPTLPLTLSLTSLNITCERDSCDSIEFDFEAGFDFDTQLITEYQMSLTGSGPDARFAAAIETQQGYYFESPTEFAHSGNYDRVRSGALEYIGYGNSSLCGCSGNFSEGYDLLIAGEFEIGDSRRGTHVVLPDSFEIQLNSPEPGSFFLVSSALLVGLGAWSWRRRRTSSD
jgi:hypothetical protein